MKTNDACSGVRRVGGQRVFNRGRRGRTRPNAAMLRGRRCVAVAGLALASHCAWADEEPTSDLFRAAPERSVVELSRIERPGVPLLRERVVVVDTVALAETRRRALVQPGVTTLRLNLFEDAAFTGIVERTTRTFSDGYSLSGRIAGRPYATMSLVVNDNSVAGSVRTPEATYRIRSAGDGLLWIGEEDAAAQSFECEVLDPPDGAEREDGQVLN